MKECLNGVEIKDLFAKQIECLNGIPISWDYSTVINNMEDVCINKVGCIFTTGIGKAGHVAKLFASTLCASGTPAIYLHPSDAQHGDLGIQQSEGMLFAFSNSGKTREVLELVNLMKKIDPHIPITVITSDLESPLALGANYVLLTGNPKELCPLGYTPTNSILAMTAISNVLVVLMMGRINFTKEQYALIHHGGYLGQKAREDASK